jgi:peptidoglycan/xylan/chitin deacetylase (PgdA/CDA1 family)
MRDLQAAAAYVVATILICSSCQSKLPAKQQADTNNTTETQAAKSAGLIDSSETRPPAPRAADTEETDGDIAGRITVTEEIPEDASSPPPYQESTKKAPGLPPVPAKLIFHGDRARPRTAITFDACETRKTTGFDRDIWSVLMEKRAKATIFLGGKWMESHPEETKMIGASDLVEIGNHSYIHPNFRKLSRKQMEEEIKRTQDIQWKLLGRQGRVFRFPYGKYNENSIKAVAEMGLYPIQWDVASGDPDQKIDAEWMKEIVFSKTQNGSIIIFHINGRGWNTAEALPDIIDELREKGFELVTVSELMGFDEAEELADSASLSNHLGK